MQYERVRALLLQQWAFTGGPHEAQAAELYHDDVVLELPQSGEWFRGKADQLAWRERYPATLNFQPREIRGGDDLWIAEGLLSYNDGEPLHYIKIIHFRGERVDRETLYFAEPFAAPEWRQPWAADGPLLRHQDDLPGTIRGGQ